MLNIAAPEKFVLTLQSIPPFLIESILAFALAILLAVPLIARLQLIFDNRDNIAKSPNPFNTSGRRLNRRPRHKIHYPSSMATTSRSSQSLQLNSMRVDSLLYDIEHSLETVASVPLTNQSEDQPEDETEEEKDENDEDTMSCGKELMNYPHVEYGRYRHALIKEHLKKNYGHCQAPGKVVMDSIHLNSIDSQRGMKNSDKYNHALLNFVESLDSSDKNYGNKYLECPEQRDLFLTREDNDNLGTIDRGTETVHSPIEEDQLPVMIGERERVNTPTGSIRRQRPLHKKKENLSNDNTNSDNAIKNKMVTVNTNSRPNSGQKIIERLLNRPRTPRSQLKPRTPIETEFFIKSNSLPMNERVGNSSDTSERTRVQLNELRMVAASAVVEKPEKPPAHVSSMVGKCLSTASSEAFSACSSRNPERRPINTRPGSSSGGGNSKAFRNSVSKVKSRPRSSGATFAWDKPDVPGKVPSYEEPTETKIMKSNSKGQKWPHASINKKKSEVLSVLESIIDLSCDAVFDFQESTVDVDIQNFRDMSIGKISSNGIESNLYPRVRKNSRISANVIKPKTPVSSSSQKRTNISANPVIDNKDFLRARSGKYVKSPVGGHNRK